MYVRSVAAWFPIRSSILDEPERASYEDDSIARWIAELPEALEELSPHLSKVSASFMTAPDNILEKLARRSPLISLRLFRMVVISAEVAFDETADQHPNERRPPDQVFLDANASFYLVRHVAIAALLSELACPGCLTIDEGVSVIDGQMFESVPSKSSFPVARAKADLTNSWPPLSNCDLRVVAKWVSDIGAFSPPLATSRIQRAFAALTQIVVLSLSREGEVLFRAMQGLEAFYCDGIGDLRKQLSDKTQLWLGSKSDPSNLVGHLYDLRSKYVHGSAKMPYAYDIADPWEHDPKTMNHFSSSVEFAVRLLIATLQRCIADSVSEVSWSYSCAATTTSRDPPTANDG
jgi:hypothetical protein